MENSTKKYSVTIYTENQVGMLVIICSLFTRRNINIEKLTAMPATVPDIHKITISCECSEILIKAVAKQLRKRVDIVRVEVSSDSDVLADYLNQKNQ